MQMEYETERLVLRLCDSAYAAALLDFVKENRADFAPWESAHPENFYTLAFQRQVLDAEFRAALKGDFIRYYFFRKDVPEKIAGTVSFSHISHGEDRSCHLGYKTSRFARGCGYTKEALQFLIAELFKDRHLHRIEADIMAENKASLHLIETLGFTFEGVARGAHRIDGVWRDHLRYAKLADD